MDPRQPIVIGRHSYVIQDLLAIASDFVVVDENTTRTELSGDWEKDQSLE